MANDNVIDLQAERDRREGKETYVPNLEVTFARLQECVYWLNANHFYLSPDDVLRLTIPPTTQQPQAVPLGFGWGDPDLPVDIDADLAAYST